MSYSKETSLILDSTRGNEHLSSNQPLYYSSTYHQQTLGGNAEYDYARSGNPNRQLLEEKLADLEGGQYGFAFSSGIAAITAVFLTLEPGDHVVLPDDVYGGTFRLTEQILKKFKIEFTTVDQTDLQQVKAAVQDNTKLIYVETPSNPLFKVTDIDGVSQIARKNNALLAVDNTFMTPLGQSPLKLGADIVIHSATKFLGGHSDLIAGAVIVNDPQLKNDIYLIQNGTGSGLSVYDSWTLAKHLKTLPIRFKQSVYNAEQIYRYLIENEAIETVYYPITSDTHLRQAKNGGAVLGFRLKDESKAQAFVDHLNIPLVSVSLGGVETILSHPATMSHAAIPEDVRAERGITNGLFRLSAGLEDVKELITDIDWALKEATYESKKSIEEPHFSS
ncbi:MULTISPECIES: cystathionine beta-lyase MetC [Mammaliicoccus]|uniref:cysteine-S-conjugate beta-lyase n=1 Tax=Mammaliicoccus vitulinus TaxID=71237 RepID=A0A2T4PX53_9STAP|nr:MULTISPECIES: cystathionine beta-lyase MetC [Mammaliicoccus]HAL10235.1 PLP-dependent transferase [Staphylococcus sp.]PNZ40513.1 cystathionine gamma-synthase [Mammaliicoccus vitulinus]PTI31085.1 cystathionine gamma-synthase [Mammaliicoccus vitulinus]PTI38722.1 cystathionine gamma-synthase [Mammaliicoccus vitulinus]PTI71382.1 cystathionine gamma-synthase [Mammaliicoccus vitulinus]